MTKKEILEHLKSNPEHILCELTKDGFKLAKALWGEGWRVDTISALEDEGLPSPRVVSWQHHLQQAILHADTPENLIDYAYSTIEEDQTND